MSGCSKDTRIRMSDNTLKNVKELKVGDEVISVYLKNGVEYIETDFIEKIIVHKCKNGLEQLVTLGNLKITPHHHIIGFGSNKWTHPIDIYKNRLEECEEVYNFILCKRHNVLIEDYVFKTYELEDNIIQLHMANL